MYIVFTQLNNNKNIKLIQKNSHLTIEVAILKLERMALWNFNFISKYGKWSIPWFVHPYHWWWYVKLSSLWSSSYWKGFCHRLWTIHVAKLLIWVHWKIVTALMYWKQGVASLKLNSFTSKNFLEGAVSNDSGRKVF